MAASGATLWPECQQVHPIVLDWTKVMAETLSDLDANLAIPETEAPA